MNTGKILVTEDIRGAGIDRLRKICGVDIDPELWNNQELLLELIGNYDGLLVRNLTRVDKKILSRSSRLRVIGRAGAGVDNIDVSSAASRGVTVVYAPEQNTRSVAELIIALAFSLARKMPAAHVDTAGGNWNRHRYTGIELHGKTLGLAGLGRIGRETGMIAQSLGMRVIASPVRKLKEMDNSIPAGIETVAFEKMLDMSDVISCQYRLTEETRNRFTKKEFNAMKESAYFINASRGGIVNEEDLIHALKEGTIAGAALDVRDMEPPGRDRFCYLENVILTPHIGSFTIEAQERVIEAVCADMVSVLEGRVPRYPCL